MLTVACVLQSGGIYTPEWVARLRAGVQRHLASAHRFVCLSDVDVPCERIPLRHGWPGWWAKMEAFSLPGPVLYIDLDTAVVGVLDDIVAHAVRTEGLTVLRDFYVPRHFGSGVMAWGGDMSGIYDCFARDATRLMATRRPRMGDQALIEEIIGPRNASFWQESLPGQIVSYKLDCQPGPCEITGRIRQGGIPRNTRLVSLHGEPKFTGMPATDPVRMAWEQAA